MRQTIQTSIERYAPRRPYQPSSSLGRNRGKMSKGNRSRARFLVLAAAFIASLAVAPAALAAMTFAPAASVRIGSEPLSVAIGDLNGDAISDHVTANPVSNEVWVLRGTGDGKPARLRPRDSQCVARWQAGPSPSAAHPASTAEPGTLRAHAHTRPRPRASRGDSGPLSAQRQLLGWCGCFTQGTVADLPGSGDPRLTGTGDERGSDAVR